MEAMIVDEEGKEVEPGKDGEVWMRGPNVFIGYLNNPEATRNCLTEEGWFKSGDVGHIDQDGYVVSMWFLTSRMFYITDRVKELIKYKGTTCRTALIIRLSSSSGIVGRLASISSKSE